MIREQGREKEIGGITRFGEYTDENNKNTVSRQKTQG